MPRSTSLVTTCAALAVSFCGCSKQERHFRGQSEHSPDHKTYLVVEDNSAACPSIHIDGRDWLHGLHSRGEIEPGKHTISCETPAYAFNFSIEKETTYHVDYWGP